MQSRIIFLSYVRQINGHILTRGCDTTALLVPPITFLSHFPPCVVTLKCTAWAEPTLSTNDTFEHDAFMTIDTITNLGPCNYICNCWTAETTMKLAIESQLFHYQLFGASTSFKKCKNKTEASYLTMNT
jgi:hypothetical protein